MAKKEKNDPSPVTLGVALDGCILSCCSAKPLPRPPGVLCRSQAGRNLGNSTPTLGVYTYSASVSRT
jgi:hypothetical protein